MPREKHLDRQLIVDVARADVHHGHAVGARLEAVPSALVFAANEHAMRWRVDCTRPRAQVAKALRVARPRHDERERHETLADALLSAAC
eukprot:1429905-Prymnesium_polylepis.1